MRNRAAYQPRSFRSWPQPAMPRGSGSRRLAWSGTHGLRSLIPSIRNRRDETISSEKGPWRNW